MFTACQHFPMIIVAVVGEEQSKSIGFLGSPAFQRDVSAIGLVTCVPTRRQDVDRRLCGPDLDHQHRCQVHLPREHSNASESVPVDASCTFYSTGKFVCSQCAPGRCSSSRLTRDHSRKLFEGELWFLGMRDSRILTNRIRWLWHKRCTIGSCH